MPCAQGRRVVGRKIGLTSQAVQRQLGVDQPDFGTLFADMALRRRRGGAVGAHACSRRSRPRSRWCWSATSTGGRHHAGRADPRHAYVLPAIEIVGSRIADWNIRFIDTVADNASSGLVVLGGVPTKLDGLDLKLCDMAMQRGGETVSTRQRRGLPRAIRSTPRSGWRASWRRSASRCERAISCSPARSAPWCAVAPGDRFEARITGVGTVKAAFGPA